MNRSSVAIIIPTYNEEKNIAACLNSIFKMGYAKDGFEVIVVDNGSSDKTVDEAKRFSIKLFVEKNRGPFYARNIGIKNTDADIVVFLDADCIVTENWLKNLVQGFTSPDVGGVGGAIYPVERTIISRYMGFSLFMRYPASIVKKKIKGAYPSCNLAVKKKALNKVGGFDEKRGLDDKDLGIRMQGHGYNFIYEPEAIVYHRNPTTFALLMKIMWRSAAKRVTLSKKYPNKLEHVVFKTYLPILYLIAMIASVLTKSLLYFSILISLPIAVLLLGAISAFKESRDFFISFMVKPVLDSISIFVISLGFFYHSFFSDKAKIHHTYLDLLEIKK